MGSLSSRPAVPTPQTQVVYIPATPAPSQSKSTSENDTKGNSASDSATHSKSLLDRSRGRFGTIHTSFRGLLGLNTATGQRKTLLGE